MFKLKFSVLLCVIITQNSFSQITQGLVGYYKFDGDFIDSSSNQNNAIDFNSTFTFNRFAIRDKAIQLNGTNAYIEIPIKNNLNPNYTISAWVNCLGYPPNNSQATIISIGGSVSDQGISLTNNYSGYSGWGVYSYSSSSIAAFANGQLPDTNRWYHIVSIRDSNSLSMYLNGALVTKINATGLPDYKGSPLQINLGKRVGGGNYAKIAMDEFKIYNRALSSSEVYTLYSSFLFNNTVVNDININVFPNPSNGLINIEASLSPIKLIRVLDLLGKEIMTIRNGLIQNVIQLKTVGSYVLEIHTEEGISRKKIIIQ
jgi:hypothetical protein